MTNAAKGSVWDAVWQPWGGIHSITPSPALNTRFPGQWYQAETGLHYNWHRSYDPSLGRYTQPDPLGFVDGPSVYGYAGGSPQRWVDKNGKSAGLLCAPAGPAGVAACTVVIPTIIRMCARYIVKEFLQSTQDDSEQAPPPIVIPGKIQNQLGPRNWTEKDVQDAIAAGPTGSTVDNTGGRNDPATVYGPKTGHVVVNDKTGEVVQVSGRNLSWIPDIRIKWR